MIITLDNNIYNRNNCYKGIYTDLVRKTNFHFLHEFPVREQTGNHGTYIHFDISLFVP